MEYSHQLAELIEIAESLVLIKFALGASSCSHS